jgi:hypothetical protein
VEDHALLRRDVEIKHLPLCLFLCEEPDIVIGTRVIGTRLPLFHLFATRTLWVRIELVARQCCGAKSNVNKLALIPLVACATPGAVRRALCFRST